MSREQPDATTMFATADWTQPQIGGLLSEIIEKEERQVRRSPKPRILARKHPQSAADEALC